ncbi:hypothetical protein IFT44_07235 [Pseudomonas sp. CFBP 13710]|nr:hypothetical protein [Pseudomonas sp. CFBP 13710]
MTIAEPPVLVFSLVAKHHTDACSRPDGYSAEVSGHWQIKTLLLSFDDSLKIEICMALSVEVYVYRVEHHSAPVIVGMELSRIAHVTRSAGIVRDYW